MNTTKESLVGPVRTARASSTSTSPSSAHPSFDDLPVSVLSFESGALIDANDEWTTISGLGLGESTGDGWLCVIYPDDRHDLVMYIADETSRSRPALSVRIGVVGHHTTWFRVHVRTSCSVEGIASAVVTLTAMGPQRRSEARLVHMSTHDGLTGLANRTRFVDRVGRALADPNGTSAMLFLDLDHFKVVNDHLGHRYGDVVLQAVCRRIESTIRSTDLAGRLGGDEIGVFCPQITSSDEVISLAERLGAALATPFTVEHQIVIIDASIGIAFTTPAVRTAEDLIDNADKAMYTAKMAGGGRWATFADDRRLRPIFEVSDDLEFGVIRADVNQAEEHTIAAWKLSTRNRDFERSARLASVREALRRASLLLRISPGVDIVTTANRSPADARSAQLQAAHDDSVAIAQATGMIAQRSGADAAESSALLRDFAAAHNIAFEIAATMLVERTIDVDSVAVSTQRRDGQVQLLEDGADPVRERAATERLAPLLEIYGEHSAAVFGCARFICGDSAPEVTERVFVTFWEQRDSTEPNATSVRARLLSTAHRLAMHDALATTRATESTDGLSQPPSGPVTAVLRRGQAVERTLACASLTSAERSVAALFVYGRCSYREVARILDRAEDDVNQQLRTSLRHIRTELAGLQ